MDACIERVVAWLRQCPLTEVVQGHVRATGTSEAVESVISAAKRHTWQQTKAFKHRAQVEAIAAHCLHRLPSTCELIVEMGAGQAVLGHAVSLASGLPLVAIERRGNSDAFDADGASLGASPGRASQSQRIKADLADDDAWPDSGQVALLAKHLCGHSSDIAVDAAANLGSRLSLLCLAPCCHATMSWTKLPAHSQEWFAQAGFPCSFQDFALLVDVIRLSRAGGSEKYVPCSKWRLRNHVDSADVELLGRRACRAIDEARLSRLRASGLDVALIDYCDSATTPDNVLILGAPAGRLLHPDVAVPVGLMPTGPEAGVLLELDPTAPPSLQQRLVAYLHEQRSTHFAAMQTVLPLTDHAATQIPGLVCPAIATGEMSQLLGQLMACVLIRRAVTRLLPFDRQASDCEAVRDAAVEVLRAGGVSGTVRVLARPRHLEATMCQALGPSWLSPARFTHMLCISPARGSLLASDACEEQDADGGAADFAEHTSNAEGPFQFALLPRAERDLSTWTAERKVDERWRGYWRSAEVAMRWPGRLKSVEAVALWTDSREAVPWLGAWADQFLPAGAGALELRVAGGPRGGGGAGQVRPSPVRGAWGAGGSRAGLLLSDVGCGGEEAVDALQALLHECTTGDAPPLAAQGLAVLRLRCGRAARAVKRWHRETAQRLEAKLGARHVELLHLLSDRDPERTAVFAWGEPPGAAATA